MHKIDSTSAIAAMPVPSAVGVPGWFSHGSVNSPYTVLSSDWCNAVQGELMNVITAAGITLDKTKQDQLLTALNKMFRARETITAATTIYVNTTTGKDTNDGRSSVAPFKTLQAAINAVYSKYDWNGQPCTIQLADGTYTASVSGGWVGSFAGNPYGSRDISGLTIQGNVANPAAVIINGVNSNGIAMSLGYLNVNGLTFQASGNVATPTAIQGWGLFGNIGAYITVTNCRFANCGSTQLEAGNGSVISPGAGNVFTGITQNSIVCDVGGQVWYPGQRITVTGLQTTQFCNAANGGLINMPGCTFVGTATGKRYVSFNNGIIATNGAGANYLPGNAPGVIGSQGQYL